MAHHQENPIDTGINAFGSGDFATALEAFRQVDPEKKSPYVRSCEAYCAAKVEGTVRNAVAVCVEAVRQDPKNCEIYLNLGRVHLMTGQKKAAMHVFNLGLRVGKNLKIVDELAALGIRRAPPLPFLPRENFINKHLGLFLRKLGIR